MPPAPPPKKTTKTPTQILSFSPSNLPTSGEMNEYCVPVMFHLQTNIYFLNALYIFTCRLKTHPTLNVLELKRKIENRLLVEKYLLLKNCEFEKFERHWENIIERI